MDAERGEPPQWVRFLFDPQVAPILVWPRGPAPGALARGLLQLLDALLAGHSIGPDPVMGEFDPRQLDAMFATDAGVDWTEVAECRKRLFQLDEQGPTLTPAAVRRVAIEFVDDFLVLESAETSRVIDDLVAYARRVRGATTVHNHEVTMPPMPKPPPFRFRLIFYMSMDCTISLAKGGNLVGGLSVVLNRLAERLSTARSGSAAKSASWLDSAYAPVDEAELLACDAALEALLVPAAFADEKVLRRSAEAFVDDYLIVHPDSDPARFVDAVAAYTLRNQRQAGAAVNMTEDVVVPESAGNQAEEE